MNSSIFSSIKMSSESIEMPISSYTLEDPYGIDREKKLKVFEITYEPSKQINNIDELEFQIANDFFIKKFGMCIDDLKIDKLKELYPELFLM